MIWEISKEECEAFRNHHERAIRIADDDIRHIIQCCIISGEDVGVLLK